MRPTTENADAILADGEMEGLAVWKRIVRVVRELQCKARQLDKVRIDGVSYLPTND